MTHEIDDRAQLDEVDGSSSRLMQAEEEPATPGRPRKRSAWQLALVLAIEFVCVGVVGRTLWLSRGGLANALHMGTLSFSILFVTMFLGHLQRTYEFTFMLRKLGVKEGFAAGFWLTGAGFLLNHLPLNAGFVMRAVVLRREHALPYSSYVSMTMVNVMVNIAVAGLAGLLGVAAGSLSGSGFHWPALIGFSAAFVASVLALWIPGWFTVKGEHFVARQARNFAAGIALIRGNGSTLFVLGLIALTKLFVVAVRLTICFDSLGRPINAVSSTLLASILNLTALVNITPGNLGLRELLVSFAAQQQGHSQSVSLAATSIDRITSILYMVAAGLPGIFMLRKRGFLGGVRPSAAAE